MYETAPTTKALGLRRFAARKARAALATALVTAAFVVPPLAAGLVAAPAHATTAGANFTVNLSDDRADANPGDGTCSVVNFGAFCSLRAAIQEANATAEKDTIAFDVGAGSDGIATITPATPLPAVTEPVTINGYTQPGASRNNLSQGTDAKPKVALDGSSVSQSNEGGLRIGASNSLVEGLVVDDFAGVAGVEVLSTADSVVVRQNFIGTDPVGAHARGNLIGVLDRGTHTVVGGASAQDANLISGNQKEGVAIVNSSAHALVSHDLIGTDRTGTGRLGNLLDGVGMSDSSGNSVRNNTIAFNGGDGVSVLDVESLLKFTPGSDRILSNSIFSNGGLGINLTKDLELAGTSPADPNDAGDGDIGPNDRQNKPVLTSAKTVSGKTTIKGKLNSRPNETYTVQFFSNPSGTNEGRKFIGQKSVTTDALGNVTFGFSPATKVSVGRTITSTATRATTHDTSEFSAPRTVASS
jgi:CSLREA domain-containing protein